MYWSPAIAEVLSPAMAGDDEHIEKDVLSGKLAVYAINSELLAVTESLANEYVICCVAGSGLNRAIPELVKLAQKAGANRIRWHAARPKVIKRIVEASGLEVQQTGFDSHGYTVFTTII